MMERNSFTKIVGASNACQLSKELFNTISEENAKSCLCISIRYESEEGNNDNPSVAVMQFVSQTCVYFEQIVRFVQADDMSQLNEKIKKLMDQMAMSENYYCTCMQTQSNFMTHISQSTAIMIFTKQYP